MGSLSQELKDAFDKTKQELGFNATFEEIEDIFFIEDLVEQDGFVSSRFDSLLCRRMSNLFWNWNNHLHNLVVPSPNSMVMVAENQMIDEQMRTDILDVMNKTMAHVSLYSVASLDSDRQKKAQFIDQSVSFWSTELQPLLLGVMGHLHGEWKLKASERPKMDLPHQHP